MRRLAPGARVAAVLASAALAAGCASQRAAQPGEAESAPGASNPFEAPARVLLVSIAGLRPHDYGAFPDGLRPERATMPTLARLASGGGYADAMTPVMPSTPYPTHASLVTGMRPDRHGLLGDVLFGDTGPEQVPYFDESRIHGLPLWRAASSRGLAVAALAWPSTVGAPIELLLPELATADPDAAWLSALEAAHATDWVVERVRALDPSFSKGPWPSSAMRDRVVREIACDIANEPVTPQLWLVHFRQTGEAARRYGPGSAGARAAFADVDHELAELLGCLERRELLSSFSIVVVGDRALLPMHTIVEPNAALAGAGLIVPRPGQVPGGIARWDAIVRSYGGAGVVYARDEKSAVLARRSLADAAARTRAFRVVSASELAALHGDPQAWFGLAATPGYGLGVDPAVPELRPTDLRATGGFLPNQPDTAVGFVAWGAGLREGIRVPRMTQIDVAPTIASLLGLVLPDAQGRPLIGILGGDPLRRALGELEP